MELGRVSRLSGLISAILPFPQPRFPPLSGPINRVVIIMLRLIGNPSKFFVRCIQIMICWCWDICRIFVLPRTCSTLKQISKPSIASSGTQHRSLRCKQVSELGVVGLLACQNAFGRLATKEPHPIPCPNPNPKAAKGDSLFKSLPQALQTIILTTASPVLDHSAIPPICQSADCRMSCNDKILEDI